MNKNMNKNLKIFLFSGSEAKGTEIVAGLDATISCIFTGITRQLDSVSWLDSDGDNIKDNKNFEVHEGTYDKKKHSQTSILTVRGQENEIDKIYTCQITASEWGKVDKTVFVPLNVFGG